MNNVVNKDLSMKITENGLFKGYVSVFDNVDAHKDIVRKGAYKRSLDHHKNKGFPVFGDHRDEIGATLKAYEDDYGLFVEAQLFLGKVAEADKKWALMQERKKLGFDYPMSIGLIVQKRDFTSINDEQVREIKEARILEFTLTPIPSNELATTKGIEEINDWYNRSMELAKEVDSLKSQLASLNKDSSNSVLKGIEMLDNALTTRRIKQFLETL